MLKGLFVGGRTASIIFQLTIPPKGKCQQAFCLDDMNLDRFTFIFQADQTASSNFGSKADSIPQNLFAFGLEIKFLTACVGRIHGDIFVFLVLGMDSGPYKTCLTFALIAKNHFLDGSNIYLRGGKGLTRLKCKEHPRNPRFIFQKKPFKANPSKSKETTQS